MQATATKNGVFTLEKAIGILIADLSGYTAMTEVHGAGYAVKIVDTFIHLVEKSLEGTSRFLERAGDQIGIISEIPDDLVRTAINLNNYSMQESHFLSIHIGLHFGQVLELDGSFYGSAMNVASRIASEAKDADILSSFEFINALKYSRAFHYILYGTRHFRNVLHATKLFKIVTEVPSHAPIHHVDPVCHMHLAEHENNFVHKIHGREHRFCSHECLTIFTNNQGQFLK